MFPVFVLILISVLPLFVLFVAVIAVVGLPVSLERCLECSKAQILGSLLIDSIFTDKLLAKKKEVGKTPNKKNQKKIWTHKETHSLL
jgi:hypothetical protein